MHSELCKSFFKYQHTWTSDKKMFHSTGVFYNSSFHNGYKKTPNKALPPSYGLLVNDNLSINFSRPEPREFLSAPLSLS